ncbi:MAG: class I SAM-dependent methyltransferase [Pseudomonadota bacterium]
MNDPAKEDESAQTCSDFDNWTEGYGDHLNASIRLSGEEDTYFHLYKLTCLKRWVSGMGPMDTILDFGCGLGSLTSLIAQTFPQSTVYGYDISFKCIEIAKKKWRIFKNLTFLPELPSEMSCDLIVAANVFHHIKPSDRPGKILQLKKMIKPGRSIVIFEHNPYNPLTRYVVQSCLFDKEAELISLSHFIRLARRSGLGVRFKRYIVFFPNFLGLFRPFEPLLGFLPLGAQYMLSLGLDEQDK